MKTHQDTAHVSCESLSVGKNIALFSKVWGVGGCCENGSNSVTNEISLEG